MSAYWKKNKKKKSYQLPSIEDDFQDTDNRTDLLHEDKSAEVLQVPVAVEDTTQPAGQNTIDTEMAQLQKMPTRHSHWSMTSC